jgi:hypothetical protein
MQLLFASTSLYFFSGRRKYYFRIDLKERKEGKTKSLFKRCKNISEGKTE